MACSLFAKYDTKFIYFAFTFVTKFDSIHSPAALFKQELSKHSAKAIRLALRGCRRSMSEAVKLVRNQYPNSFSHELSNKKKAIEIDGQQHQRFTEYKLRDEKKNEVAKQQGWIILRLV